MSEHSTALDKPIRPMTIDDLMIQLTASGYVRGDDLGPPDSNGFCSCNGPEDGIAHWRVRARWQPMVNGLDFISIYPRAENDPEGDTFLFVLFNPRNGVIREWRIAEHWTGEDFVVIGCDSLQLALSIYQNWLLQITS